MEPPSSLPYSQGPATCPCPEPDQSSPRSPSRFLKINFNIDFPPTPRSSKWSLSLRFSHSKPVCIFPVPHACYMPCQSFIDLIFLSKLFSNTRNLCSITLPLSLLLLLLLSAVTTGYKPSSLVPSSYVLVVYIIFPC